ncbi:MULTISPECIES: hypothetical protein [Xanthomonas]|uniref:hypothetical protein n=1 Tax=Xanthomonas TaxID=338 RepID=UPI0005312BFF|nr:MULTISPECIES: hypothetical protein [Xanthomonas]KGR44472.1 hypothetical protein NX04_07035 [Xanthomonas vasicola]KGU41821.1 hypothetical protein NY95_11995 [Xanthomonas citri pv. fuscans]TWQ40705.1 hypothetical protein FQJ96_06025 [Xanthomonas vasicola]TWQ61099.1 hypothetical protein FQJ93_03845 [Xanthomonas vasicola]TWQ71593.1 hypothetical protein FQJ89_22080 [Xanthomonas vasicola]
MSKQVKQGVVDVRKLLCADPVLMLAKLATETVDIIQRRTDEVPLRIFQSMNAASTAWHLHQWIWELASDEDRRTLARAFGASKENAVSFGEACRKHSIAITICRQIATATKHVRLEHDRDDIYAEAITSDDASEPMKVLYYCDGVAYEDWEVFQTALDFWADVYVQLGFESAHDVVAAMNAPALSE